MGCLWSSQGTQVCQRCNRREVNNLVIIDNLCEICIRQAASRSYCSNNTVQARKRAYYGEYKCVCGRFWPSRLSWKDAYQICKRCKRQVYPHSQRELLDSDLSGTNENTVEHEKELCQMCQQLGEYCGYRARAAARGHASRSRSRSVPRTQHRWK
ncbi:zinc finger CCHC domain-containing protein 24-like [Pectinophora gossypiella]|uniref:zinc finger CCHC domain-containing protein 24-like n=1 Tax=Pectinophora gossypiella TaxID=13191 RepID=UPI00214E8059|nr:zinc finger CCHC domain-containing protein 24-like [Pectinophora gossypiella]